MLEDFSFAISNKIINIPTFSTYKVCRTPSPTKVPVDISSIKLISIQSSKFNKQII